jgi:uncharacterized Zn finger protein (UPF0148 family)
MNYCPKCGSKKDGNFCAECGFNFKTEKKQSEQLAKKSADSENSKNPKKTKGVESNYDDFQKLNFFFSKNKTLYSLKEIPIKSLLKLIRLFDYKNDENIKNLNHLIYYRIEESNTAGGWDAGFSVAINSNKLYLLISSAEPLNILHKSTKSEKIGIYEIYDYEQNTFINSISVEGDFLLITQSIGLKEIIKHNISNHQMVINDLINLLNHDIQILNSLKNHSVFLDKDTLKKNNKLTLDELTSNCLVFVIGGVLLLMLILWILSIFA